MVSMWISSKLKNSTALASRGRPKSHNGRTVVHPLQALGSISSASVSSALVPVTESQDRQPWTTSTASSTHVPRPFGHGGHPCPAEPKMDDLPESLRPLSAEASPAKMLLINVGMKYGGHFLKKFPTGPMPDLAEGCCDRAKHDDTGYAYTSFCPNAQDCA